MSLHLLLLSPKKGRVLWKSDVAQGVGGQGYFQFGSNKGDAVYLGGSCRKLTGAAPVSVFCLCGFCSVVL